jgi:regulator of replication initiation timing
MWCDIVQLSLEREQLRERVERGMAAHAEERQLAKEEQQLATQKRQLAKQQQLEVVYRALHLYNN